jgi:hypothetical protein
VAFLTYLANLQKALPGLYPVTCRQRRQVDPLGCEIFGEAAWHESRQFCFHDLNILGRDEAHLSVRESAVGVALDTESVDQLRLSDVLFYSALLAGCTDCDYSARGGIHRQSATLEVAAVNFSSSSKSSHPPQSMLRGDETAVPLLRSL